MLDRVVDDREIVDGLARAFDLHLDDVSLIDDTTERQIRNLDEHPVIVELAQLSGDFPLQLSIYLRRSDLEQRVCDPSDEQEQIAQLCATWKCSALFSDDALNPYRWFLMSAAGRLEEVSVDADRLDSEDAFVITRVDRLVRQIPAAV
jgi:hypothetical protein